MAEFVPYCGSAPLPGELVWKLDPVLLGTLGAVLIGHCVWAYRRMGKVEQTAFIGGWVILTLAFVSPLCKLSVALYSARMGQHILISLLAAPLIVLGGLDVLVLRRRRLFPGEPLLATVAFLIALWGWQVPPLYDSTLQDNVVYWAMHLTILLSALWVWRAIIRSQLLASSAVAFLTGMQMTALGALLTFAPRPLYWVHFQTTVAWGFTPLEDQQLGGLLMWVPAGILLLAAFLIPTGISVMRSSRQQTPLRDGLRLVDG